jgi:hypothetical protein
MLVLPSVAAERRPASVPRGEMALLARNLKLNVRGSIIGYAD